MNIYDLEQFCLAMEKECTNLASLEGRWEEAEPFWYLKRVYQSLGNCVEFCHQTISNMKDLSPYDMCHDCDDPDFAMTEEVLSQSAERMEKAIQFAANFFVTGNAKEREVKEDDIV